MARREQQLQDAIARIHRGAVVVALVGTALLFSRGLYDSFQLAKVTVVVVAATVAAAATIYGWVRAGQVTVPGSRPILAVAAAFLVAIAISAVVSGELTAALTGPHGRWTGAIAYVAYVVLFLASARSFDHKSLRVLAWTLVGSMVVTSLYAVAQATGADPFTWGEESMGTVFSTLGNPNFAGGYLGAVVPFGLWAATASRTTLGRIVGGALAALGAQGAILTGTLQGVAVAAGSAVVFGLVYVWLRLPKWRRAVLFAAVALVVAALGVGFLLTLDNGPLEALAAEGNLRFRGYYWGAAWAMFAARPLLGVGLGQYLSYYSVYRSPEAAAGLDFTITTNAAHNVPLEMFATGGLVLGLAYVAFIAMIGWVVVSGLRRAANEPVADPGRAGLVAALVASWVGYQAQSLISIDVPALATLHWVMAGCLVAVLADPQWRSLALPWHAGRGRLAGAPTVVVGGLVAVLLLPAVAVPLVRQLRGDGGAFGVNRFLSSERPDIAVDEGEKSVAAAPWQGEYWDQLARAYRAIDDRQAAAEAYDEAIARAPRRVHYRMFAATNAEQAGDTEAARAYYAQARELDPLAPEIRGSNAQFELNDGDPDAAAELIEEALEIQDDRAVWWILRGAIERERGNTETAVEAYERVIELAPDSDFAAEARQALSELGA